MLTFGTGTTGSTAVVTAIDQTTNNLVLLHDPDPNGGKFWPMDSIDASCFQAYHNGTELLFYSGDAVAGYINQQDIGTEDFGSSVSAYWRGKNFDQDAAEHEKNARQAFIGDSPDQVTPATLKLSTDYGDFNEWTYKRGDGLMREYRVPSAYRAKWRFITPEFSHASAGGCEIRSLMLMVKTSNKPKGRTAPV
jgi:hypothetical protein